LPRKFVRTPQVVLIHEGNKTSRRGEDSSVAGYGRTSPPLPDEANAWVGHSDPAEILVRPVVHNGNLRGWQRLREYGLESFVEMLTGIERWDHNANSWHLGWLGHCLICREWFFTRREQPKGPLSDNGRTEHPLRWRA
jgi:hypothetical protein